MKGISHNIIKNDSGYFIVEYVSPTGKTKVTYYSVPLTRLEIEEEYNYVVFD